ncbi:NHS-like protein 1 isoform X6 [Mesoplodon densirostris]|uniref:NHS-like protein 1 isoform X6 n=1 Tax=Mesoplodon densirostris TaxID=48708 RepID=UPI0028DCEA84|nr:NHS-like protein 1 isoform X6 [Mesoplodon densirostris]
MPFHQRTVEPARLRQPEAAGAAGAPLFRSLEQVSSHALVCLLEQLADLSRCAGDIFGELEGQAATLGRRTAALHRRLDALHASTARLDHRRVKIPVSNLDEESRWTVHYTAPWHQQENVFLPTTRPPCVEDLHRQAKLNLKSVLRECDKLRQDGYRSSQYYSQGPTFAANSSPFCDDYQDEDEEPDPKCSVSSSEEERLSTRRPKTPTSSDFSDLNTQTNWTKSLPLPTPEEKMRQQAQTVQADVVPINITGENFDRQASLRRSLIYTDTLVRRPKKVKRRKTITGVPDSIQKELALGDTGQDDVGGHSVDTPDHYSTLGRLDNYRSAGQRSETRDSSCQTEAVKILPPSMRRIRAQKGQGIAAQMSHFPGSSGNMSVLSDSVGVVFPSRFNSDAGFHSLPRSGARTNVQSLEPRLGALRPAEDADETLAYQTGHLQVDEDFGHLGAAPGTGTLLRPKSQELGHLEGEKVTSSACVVSPHTTYSTSIIPNATLSSSSEVIVIHTAQSLGQLDSKITSSSSYTKIKSRDHFLSRQKDGHHSPHGNWTEGHSTIFSQASDPHSSSAATLLSLCDSAVSLNTPANRENGSQAMAYHGRNNLSFLVHPQDLNSKSESRHSGGRGHGSAEPWEYSASASGRASPRKPHLATPGYSTPVSNMSGGSLDQTSKKDGARAVYPGDHDGYYTSLHTSSGHGPGNVCNSSDGFGNPRHSVVSIFDGRARKNQGDRSNCQDKTLSRNISLKKAKKPPLPPSRTDSLRRIPKKSVQSNGQVLNESLIASLQHSLQLKLPGKGGSSPSQSPCSDFEEPWLPRSRSQSTVSAGSSLTSATTPNVYALSGVTPAQSDTSSVKSEYTDPWGYYIDYTGVQEDPGNPGGAGPAGSAASPGNGPGRHLPDGSRAAVAPVPDGAVKPKITSPEKSHRVTSPSSGYSSQSNTPTTLTPVPVFLKSVSPANGRGKPKPKVPERKSSLVSSVSISSSSTSLSSNTSTEGSGTMKRLDSVLATPLAAPPLPSVPSPCPRDKSPFLPPPPPPADFPEGSPLPGSPLFPSPPPEALTPFCPPTDAFFPPTPTALSPLLHSSASLPPLPPAFPPSVPPPAPPLDPKLMKDARPPFKKAGQPEPSREACRQPSTKEEGGRPPMPLITTEALQMVQLRPVRKNSGTDVALLREHTSQEKRTPVVPQYHVKPSALLKSRNSINEMESESQPASATSSLPTPAKSSTQGHQDSVAERGLPSRSPGRAGEAEAGPGTAPPHEPPSPSPSRKPPPVSKKPKLFLVVPPPQRDFTAEPAENVSKASPSPMRGEARERCAAGAGSDETDSGSSVLAGGAARSESPGRVEANVPMVQPDASPAPSREEPGAERSVDAGDNVESCLSLQDPGPGVPEADTAGSSSETCDFCKEDGSDEVMTPSRPRTTEDLFAAIHRSKRKVLGRKDSDDDHSRNHSPSPPVTPTGAAPSLASQKQVGSIQRSIRKSSTSSDNFKALLLKKGSRSDTSARMSAAEMLKNTDPRFQRSRSEPSPDTPESPSSCSPSKNRRAQEEWAKNEGSMPRSLSFSGPRYGRSRTPPSAASSRYSVRNRIQSSPMTVISEGEGEATEPVDSRALRALGAARGRSLEALAGDGGGEGSLLCAGQPAASRAQAPGPTEGRPSAEGTDPSEQRGGPQREES